jgi:hypothetical protein
MGNPTFWKLRLSYSEYDTLKKGISKSISSHHGDYKHLLEKEYALYLIIYYAEWYKTCILWTSKQEKMLMSYN